MKNNSEEAEYQNCCRTNRTCRIKMQFQKPKKESEFFIIFSKYYKQNSQYCL